MDNLIQSLAAIADLRIRQCHQFLYGKECCIDADLVRELCWLLEKYMRDLRGLQHNIVSHFLNTAGCDETTYGLHLPSVDISEQDGCYHLRFGAILPIRVRSRNDLLCEELEQAILQFMDEHRKTIPIFEKAVVVFEHHYRSSDNPSRKLRDYDNLERKAVVDALVPFFIADDGPRTMRSFDRMVEDQADYTEVIIMDWPSFQSMITQDKASF